MSQIKDVIELTERLYLQGSTNNEALQELLVLLKEISDSSPESLRQDFLEAFSGLDLAESVLGSTSTMLMMLLNRLAILHKPTERSESFIKSRQAEESLVIKLREAEYSLKDYFHSRFT
jgi:hypothetical protein